MKTEHTPLGFLEETAYGLSNFEGKASAHIELTRSKFEELQREISEEYEDVSMTLEKIPNQLSNCHGILLHGVSFVFIIKD